MKPTIVIYTDIKFDDECYPRQAYDRSHAARIADAIAAGQEIPPIVLEHGTNVCVDGFHRCRAFFRIFGKDAVIPCVYRKFKNRRELILEAARLNATHGKSLSTCDRAHFGAIARRNGIKDADAALALSMTEKDYDALLSSRLAFSTKDTTSPDVSLKSTVKHLAGKTLTKQQREANVKLGGMRQVFYVNQVILLLRSNMVDRSDESVMEALVKLREALDSFL